MAELIDEQDEFNLEDGEELGTFDEPEEATVEEEEEIPDTEDVEEESQEEDDDLPEKYKGKSAKDIIRMHQEAEKLLGRQSSEVGELRKLVDNFILSQTEANKPKDEDEDIDFFEDPKRAVEAAIAKHPKIKEAEQLNTTMKQQQARALLEAQHPDFNQILGDQEFGQWVANSKVRLELFARADRNYDYDAANELLTTWKERKAIVNKTKEVEEKEIKRQRKAASTGGGKGGGEGRSRKVYRRADIINLMQNDPDRYMQLADEITKAYAEGRVK